MTAQHREVNITSTTTSPVVSYTLTRQAATTAQRGDSAGHLKSDTVLIQRSPSRVQPNSRSPRAARYQ
jgi:hypothetical protein